VTVSLSFALDPEQEEFRKVVRAFVLDAVAPAAEGFNERREFPLVLVGQMAELGLFGIPFEEEYGGMGGDYLTLCLAIEEIARADSSVAITLEAAVGLGSSPIHRFGNDEQKHQWLPPLARGEQLGAFGFTEPGGGSDVFGGTRTRAVADGGDWVINGSKAFITNVGTPISTVCTLTAFTGDREMTAIIVPTASPGFSVSPPYRKVGWHGSDTREVALEDVRVPMTNTLGERGAGFRNFLSTLDDGRIAISALAVGLIQGCVDECVRYSQERESFGKPLAKHQAVAFKIADMEVSAQTARYMYWNAAWRRAQGMTYKREASIAKLYSSERAVTAAREACQVFGGYGFMTEYPVGRFYQDAKILEIGEGTSEVQRILICRDLGL